MGAAVIRVLAGTGHSILNTEIPFVIQGSVVNTVPPTLAQLIYRSEVTTVHVIPVVVQASVL